MARTLCAATAVLSILLTAQPASAAITGVPIGIVSTIAPYGVAQEWCYWMGNQVNVPGLAGQISFASNSYSRLNWGAGCGDPYTANRIFNSTSVLRFTGTTWILQNNCLKVSTSYNTDSQFVSASPPGCVTEQVPAWYTVQTRGEMNLPANVIKYNAVAWGVYVDNW